jgi:hypothetical protein
MPNDTKFILKCTTFGNILLRYNSKTERFEYFCNRSAVSIACLMALAESFAKTFAFRPPTSHFIRLGRLGDL